MGIPVRPWDMRCVPAATQLCCGRAWERANGLAASSGSPFAGGQKVSEERGICSVPRASASGGAPHRAHGAVGGPQGSLFRWSQDVVPSADSRHRGESHADSETDGADRKPRLPPSRSFFFPGRCFRDNSKACPSIHEFQTIPDRGFRLDF